jgi:cell cycle sensor histidine kinase DivJ
VRTGENVSVIEARLTGLVHESAQADPAERARHERFIVSRMSVGVVALAGIPPYLLMRGVPSVTEAVALVCLVIPLVAAILLSRTGLLDLAHALSSAALAGLILCIAMSSGGLLSPATVWLVAIPLEALMSGSRRAAIASSVIAVAAAVALVLLDMGGFIPLMSLWPIGIAVPVFALTAIAHATALALAHVREAGTQEATIRAQEAQDRSLLQAIDDLVTWHDENGLVTKASPAAAKLLGAPAHTLLGRGLFARVHVSDRPAFVKAISDAAQSERPVAVQFRLQAGDGEGPSIDHSDRRLLWVEMRAHRVENGDTTSGRAAGVVAVARDITDHKKHEEDLEAARARAERADELKGRFLATVSHELRTPLNAVIGFSEILSGEHAELVDVAQRKEYAKLIHDSGRHLLEVVNTLLDMSKIETGNFDFAPEPFDASALANGCCDMIQLRAKHAGVQLVRQIAPGLPELVADRRACRQILINLLSNAVKFTPYGGEIVMSLTRDRDRLVLSVSDTGVGVPELDLPRLGDPFFQAGTTYDRPHEGTGLGLSVVRGLVALHGGSLSIESGVGEGTCVTVRLPFDCRTRSGRPAAIPIEVVARRTSKDGGMKKSA